MSLINTRDCFAFDLIVRETKFTRLIHPAPSKDTPTKESSDSQQVEPIQQINAVKKEFFFSPDNLPDNYSEFISPETQALIRKKPEEARNPFNYPVGIVSYENFYTHEELLEIERQVETTERHCENRAFLPMTAQQTFSRCGPEGSKKGRLVRTKFFFGYRYIWTPEQLAEPMSFVAAGVRRDVSHPPLWIKTQME